jgi:hypothetical protein
MNQENTPFTILSFEEYCQENINNLENLSLEEKHKSYNLYERNTVMQHIMDMDFNEFNDKLIYGKLPFFIRAEENDPDYQILYRDTNLPVGPERAYVHREQLRKTSEKIYILNHLYSFEQQINYFDRQEAMDKILSMEQDEFIKCLKDDKLPIFNLAIHGDIDYQPLYREFSASHGDDWAFWNKHWLRSVHKSDFMRICYGNSSS